MLRDIGHIPIFNTIGQGNIPSEQMRRRVKDPICLGPKGGVVIGSIGSCGIVKEPSTANILFSRVPPSHGNSEITTPSTHTPFCHKGRLGTPTNQSGLGPNMVTRE